MKIGLVIPLLDKVAGNRLAIDFAFHLNMKKNEIHIFSEIASPESLEYLNRRFEKSYIHIRSKKKIKNRTSFQYFKRRLSSIKDKRLAKTIENESSTAPFDWVLVYANEGHFVPLHLKKFKTMKNTKTALVVMELIEHIFYLNSSRGHKKLINLMSFLLPFLHKIEQRNVTSFDLILSNSEWTSNIFEYFYGIKPIASLGGLDTDYFKCPDETADEDPYIVVPTASLSGRDRHFITSLSASGIKLISYGPTKVEGPNHLGYLGEQEMKKAIGNARAMIFLFSYEALGLIPLESLSLGTPVITYPKQGPFATLRNNENVCFVKSYDEILTVAKKCMSGKKTLEESKGCRESVKEFSIELLSERLISILNNTNS